MGDALPALIKTDTTEERHARPHHRPAREPGLVSDMPRKHQGPYLPRHGEPVTDKTRSGHAVVHPGTPADSTDVRWSDGSTERTPHRQLSHDHANCGDGGSVSHCGW